MKHMLRLFCVILCCVFMARYIIQFSAFIPKIGSKIFPKEFVDGFDLYAAGLQKYHHPKLLFVYLLALSVLALMLLLEVKIISIELKNKGMQALWDSKREEEEEKKEEEEETSKSKVRCQTTTALLSNTPVRKSHHAKRHAVFNDDYDDRAENITIRVNVPAQDDGRREICDYLVYDMPGATTMLISQGILKSFLQADVNALVTLYDSKENVIPNDSKRRLSEFGIRDGDIIRAIVRVKGGLPPSRVERVKRSISRYASIVQNEVMFFLTSTSSFWVVLTALCVALHKVDGMRLSYVLISMIYLCKGNIQKASRVLFFASFVVAMLEYVVQFPMFLIDHSFWEPGNVTTWLGLDQLRYNDGMYNSTDPRGNICRAELLEIGVSNFFTLFFRTINWFGGEIAISVMCALNWWTETCTRRNSWFRSNTFVRHVWTYMDHLLCLSCSFVILIAGADHLSAVSLIYLSMSLVFFVFPNRVNPKWIMHVVAVMFMIQYVFILGVPFLERASERGFCSQITTLRENPRWQVWLCGVGVVNEDSDKIGNALVSDLFCVLFVWLWWQCVSALDEKSSPEDDEREAKEEEEKWYVRSLSESFVPELSFVLEYKIQVRTCPNLGEERDVGG